MKIILGLSFFIIGYCFLPATLCLPLAEEKPMCSTKEIRNCSNTFYYSGIKCAGLEEKYVNAVLLKYHPLWMVHLLSCIPSELFKMGLSYHNLSLPKHSFETPQYQECMETETAKCIESLSCKRNIVQRESQFGITSCYLSFIVPKYNEVLINDVPKIIKRELEGQDSKQSFKDTGMTEDENEPLTSIISDTGPIKNTSITSIPTIPVFF